MLATVCTDAIKLLLTAKIADGTVALNYQDQ